MNIKKLRIIIISAITLSVFACIGAENIPSDVTPFVQLAYLVKVTAYKNPIIDDEGNLINSGVLVEEKIINMPVGSGTIISREGLILTNYHVCKISDEFYYDSDKNLLYIAKSLSQTMLVYVLKDNDPLKVPVLSYHAAPVSLDKKHDTAILKIVADQDGQKISKDDFGFASVGNPFDMKLNENITIIGYPAKGGKTITITQGKFLGYYRDEYFFGLDGFIKTNAAMSPGNSGGAAMNKENLIGVPTMVTSPMLAGSDLSYIHPVTWSVKSLTVAKQKYGFRTPEIPITWLKSDYNTDETLKGIYVTGKVISAHSHNPLSANVIIARQDQTFKQIQKLHLQLQAIVIVYFVKELQKSGLSVREIAEEIEIPQKKVKKLLEITLSKDDLPSDVVSYLEQEFFYEITQCDDDGFFILNIPQGKVVNVYIFKEGFRTVVKKITTTAGSAQSLGKIKIYQF